MADVELKLSLEDDLKKIRTFVGYVPGLNKRYLRFLGKKGRTALKEQFYSGQVMTLKAYPSDKAGKRTIASDVNRQGTYVKFYSYPGNLFEKDYMRKGHKVHGEHAIQKGLKQHILANLNGYNDTFDRLIQKDLAKV
jgi:hypothetical protein